MQALNDMHQERIRWDCGTRGMGILISDSMMFQREQPTPSDPNMAQFYGLALPLLKRGMPVTPVQLENAPLPGFLADQRVLLLTYQGQKPLSAAVHQALASWVKKGGVLVMADDDNDAYNHVREWWNNDGKNDRVPRQHLFETLGIQEGDFNESPGRRDVGKGAVVWLRENPVSHALSTAAEARLSGAMKTAAEKAKLAWRESNFITLRRGPYLIGAGLDETLDTRTNVLRGRFVNLFDPELSVKHAIALAPGTRVFLLDLDAAKSRNPRLLASACKALPLPGKNDTAAWTVEGVGETPALMLIACAKEPRGVELEGEPIKTYSYDSAEKLLRVRFANEPRPRMLTLKF
jgi:hypothetical protein